ncbi:MAG: hypothetical protein RKH07_06015 [Gammaproteobacteria bacterium]
MRYFLLQLALILASSAAHALSVAVAVIELSQDEITRSGIVVDLIQRTEVEPRERESLSFTADFSAFSECGVGEVIISSSDAQGNVVFSALVGESQGLHYFQIRDDFLENTQLSVDCRPTGPGYIPKRYTFSLEEAFEAI